MDKRIRLVLTILFLDVVIGTAISPIVPEFVKHLPYPSFMLGLGMGLFTGMQLFSSTILGVLSDKFGRRPMFMLSAAGTLFFNLVLFPMRASTYFINRAGDGVTNGIYTAINSAIADISPKEEYYKNIGFEGAAASIGVIIGPALSGALLAVLPFSEKINFQLLILVICTLAAFNFFLCWSMPETHQALPETPHKFNVSELKTVVSENIDPRKLWAKITEKASNRPVLKQLVVMRFLLALSMGYYFYYVNYLSLGALQMTPVAIAYNFMYFGAVNVLSTYLFFTFWAEKLNKRRAIFVLSLLGVGIHIWYANVGTSVFSVYAVTTVDCFTLSYIGGLLEGMLASQTTDTDRGEIFGISQGLNSLANFLTTIIFTLLSLISPEMPFYWFGAAIAVVAYMGLKLPKTELVPASNSIHS